MLRTTDITVGLGRNITDTNTAPTPLHDVLNYANQGTDYWESCWTDDPARRRHMKNKWPVVATPHGVFADRRNDQPITWSGLTYHDLDHAFLPAGDDTGHRHRNSTLTAVLAHPHVIAAGVSLSGQGLSVLIAHTGIVNEESWDAAWQAAHRILKYDIQLPAGPGLPVGEWDTAVANPARAWFVAPLMTHRTATPMPAPALPPQRPLRSVPLPTNQPAQNRPIRALGITTPPDSDPTPEQWGQRLGLKYRCRQWEGPCPLCGGKDRFFVTAGDVRNARIHCRKCGPFDSQQYADIMRKVWPT